MQHNNPENTSDNEIPSEKPNVKQRVQELNKFFAAKGKPPVGVNQEGYSPPKFKRSPFNPNETHNKLINELNAILTKKNPPPSSQENLDNSLKEVDPNLHVRIPHYSESYHKETLNNYLKLSSIYHMYQRCLKEALHYIAAIKLSRAEIPSIEAIESLNHRHDFYKYLPTIELFWPDAGKTIRVAETKLVFINKYNDLTAFSAMLDKKNYSQFENDFTKYLEGNSELKQFIENGNGLDQPNHPWTKNHLIPFSESKYSIEFFLKNNSSDITVQNAVREIKKNMDYDGAGFILNFARRQ